MVNSPMSLRTHGRVHKKMAGTPGGDKGSVRLDLLNHRTSIRKIFGWQEYRLTDTNTIRVFSEVLDGVSNGL